MKKWKLLNSNPVFTSKWLTLLNNTYMLPNGTVVKDYYHIDRPNYVLVIALNANSEVLVETQYRRGVDEVIFELPAGWISQCEDVLEGAKREMLEETGYSGSASHLGEVYPHPGFISMKAFVVLMLLESVAQEPKPEEDENILCEFKTQSQIEDMIKANQIKDMGFLCAWALFKTYQSSS